MKAKRIKKKPGAAARQINKWLALLAGIIAVGGVMGFGLIAFLANVAGESIQTYNPIWMIYMIPVMLAIAVPVTVFIARAVYKHFDVLSEAMEAVTQGKNDAYIPTAGAGAFTGIYTNFNKMAAEILGIQKLRGQILDGFSHELKTPVASINGFARLLLEESVTDENRRKYLVIIVKESERLASLARNSLLLNRIEAQEIIGNRQHCNLAEQIKEVVIAQERSWTDKNIEISVDLNDVIYDCDPLLTESLWQNLLSNAIKFTEPDGQISISLSQTAGTVRAVFTDSGVGMSAEVKTRIFERYYQADPSRGAEGSGLGLSIVKRIVELCGGKILVDSTEGRGSTFTVLLPAKANA